MATVYHQLLERIFVRAYAPGAAAVPFVRTDIDSAADELGLARPKNLGDLLYTYRFRAPLPDVITQTAPVGKEWIIAGAGKGKYTFRLSSQSRVRPNTSLLAVKIPDATPQAIVMHALGDEQALLAKVRYNRLIDTFRSAECCEACSSRAIWTLAGHTARSSSAVAGPAQWARRHSPAAHASSATPLT